MVRFISFGISLLLHVAVIYVLVLGFGLKEEEKKTLKLEFSDIRVEESPPPHRESMPKRVKKKRRIIKKVRKRPPKAVSKRKIEKKSLNQSRKEIAQQESRPQKPEAIPSRGYVERAREGKIAYALPADIPLHSTQTSEEKSPSEKKVSAQDYEDSFKRENLSLIREIVGSYITYPPIARRMGWEGTVVLSFRLLPDGSLESVKVLKSSGHEILDRNALTALKRSSGKLPKPERAVVVELPVVYRLY